MTKNLAVLALLLLSYTLSAQENTDKKAQEPSPVPDMLSHEFRGIVPMRNSFFIYGGFFYGDSLGNTYSTGADYNFNITKNFAIGPSFTYSIAEFDKSTDYSAPGFFVSDDIYKLNLTGLLYNPLAVNMNGRVVRGDLFLLLGAGAVHINRSWEPNGIIGGGLRVFVHRSSLAIRVDMRTNLHTTGKPQGNNFDMDLELLVGVSLHIPPQIRKAKQSI